MEHCECAGKKLPHFGEIKISDTQRYKMCGNAVTVNVIQAIMEKLLV
jgi:site-specific DNA-cytosine methylase